MNNFKETFERDGFLILPNFCHHEACDALMERAEVLTKAFDYHGLASVFQTTEQSTTTDDYFLASGNNISFFFEKDAFDAAGVLIRPIEQSLNKIGHALHDLDEVFAAFSRSPALQQLAAQLGMQSHVIIQSMYIFKHAKIGEKVDVHQDATFLYTEPASCIGFWFALEDATIENGCLWAATGGHKTKLRERFRRNPTGGTYMQLLNDTAIDIAAMQPLEVKKVTCIVLHGLLPHYSMPNTSQASRHAYTLHSIHSQATYPTDNWLQRSIEPLRGF